MQSTILKITFIKFHNFHNEIMSILVLLRSGLFTFFPKIGFSNFILFYGLGHEYDILYFSEEIGPP